MNETTLNPVDGLPEWKGRPVTTEVAKRRAAKRSRRFVMVGWSELATSLCAYGADQPTRLLMVIHLQARLQRTVAKRGWTELVHADLHSVGLVSCNLSKAVAKLEQAGVIEVRRRPGKRPLVRLVKACKE
jgi:hypothetical protein